MIEINSPAQCPHRVLRRMYVRPMCVSSYQCSLREGFYCLHNDMFPEKCPLREVSE